MGFLTKTLNKLQMDHRNKLDRAEMRDRFRNRLRFEQLEDRRLMAGVIPNDPGFAQQWTLHNTGQSGGKYDADIDMPAAWSISTGSMTTVVGVLDSGVDYTDPDLYLNIWLNQGEIPAAIAASLTDVDGDGIFTFRDLNAPVNAPFVTNVNGNGYIDGGDLLNDARWENGVDEDNNGKNDDLIGWDFRDNDNDPYPNLNDTHGTGISQRIAAMGNNGVGTTGVMWTSRLMPIRMQVNNGDRIIEHAAAGLDYAVAQGATISSNSWGDFTYSQVMFDAIARARLAGHLFVASAGNDSADLDVTPRYPASYNLDNVFSVMALDANDQKTPTGSWGQVNVDLGAPTDTGANSQATPHVTGVAGLLRTLHPDWTYAQIKAQIMATVDPLPSLAGKCVSGGRVNAAAALATTSISISDPSINESDSGTSQLVFTVTRVGDYTGSLTLNWSTANGTASAGSDYVAAAGQVTFLPSGVNTQSITVNVNGDLVAEANETFFVTLSVASGNAVLADELGQATILDNDTKFYVVNDGSLDWTYEYGANSSALENYALANGNTAPRGAASTAAGSKVWVVDSNKKVYVYNTSGGLLGSWTAAGLNVQAQIEGIATNGTDIWLVDNKQHKVFKYTNAASLLSGSQNAASSFNLNSGNSNPKDLVTDGTSIWVVNDSSTDMVFKYTVSGTFLGSWTINSGGGSPTGITLDPSNASQSLWIVDSNSDRVYEYANARSKTSGSQAANVTFALAAGNTNPQGIADPPAGLTPTPVVATNDSRPVAPKAISLLAPQLSLGNQPATGDAQSRLVVNNVQGVDQYMGTLARLASTPSSTATSSQAQWSEEFNSLFSTTTDDDQYTDGELAESESSDLLLQLSQNLLQSNNR